MTPKASTPPTLPLLSIGSRLGLIVPRREILKPIPNRLLHAGSELREAALEARTGIKRSMNILFVCPSGSTVWTVTGGELCSAGVGGRFQGDWFSTKEHNTRAAQSCRSIFRE